MVDKCGSAGALIIAGAFVVLTRTVPGGAGSLIFPLSGIFLGGPPPVGGGSVPFARQNEEGLLSLVSLNAVESTGGRSAFHLMEWWPLSRVDQSASQNEEGHPIAGPLNAVETTGAFPFH